MSERLKRHTLRYRLNGLPIYDDYPYDDEIIGYVAEPQWQWADLTEDEQTLIRAEAAKNATRHDVDDDFGMWAALCDRGIACFHRWVNHEPVYRECAMCRSWEQLPGRIVHVGDQTLRVEDPPPRTLRIPRPVKLSALYVNAGGSPDAWGPQVDEYRWDGSRYVIASR